MRCAALPLCRARPSLLAIAQLDDLAGEQTAVNLPGTDRERDWRRKLPKSLVELLQTPRAGAILAGLRRNVDHISAAYLALNEIDAAGEDERFSEGA
jgi:glycogen operon protein